MESRDAVSQVMMFRVRHELHEKTRTSLAPHFVFLLALLMFSAHCVAGVN